MLSKIKNKLPEKKMKEFISNKMKGEENYLLF
jgi:hypothetical protein